VKRGAAADYDTAGKYLTCRDVERLIEAVKGSLNEAYGHMATQISTNDPKPVTCRAVQQA